MLKIHSLNDYVVLWSFHFKYGSTITHCVYKSYCLENHILWAFFGFFNEENPILYIPYENTKKKYFFVFWIICYIKNYTHMNEFKNVISKISKSQMRKSEI